MIKIKNQNEGIKVEIVKEWLKTILYAFIIVLALYFIAWPVTIEGDSMKPTFLDGDKVVTSRVLTMTGKYKTGDIVVFHMIDEYGQRDVIKRVIGIEGDTIEIKEGKYSQVKKPENIFNKIIEENFPNLKKQNNN